MNVTNYASRLARSIVPMGIVAGCLALLSPPASALVLYETIMASGFNDNDCSGFFNNQDNGNGFESCEVNGSPVIAKFENDDGDIILDEANETDFPTIDAIFGTEWSFDGDDPPDNSSGTWWYNPGPGDPGIRYWAAKGGNDFKLFWVIDASDFGLCGTNSFNDGIDTAAGACLDAAVPQLHGIWSTPGGEELSHITFYDTGRSVPEPGALMLLATGLLGLGLLRRRARQSR